jgi:hypothetical protein
MMPMHNNTIQVRRVAVVDGDDVKSEEDPFVNIYVHSFNLTFKEM